MKILVIGASGMIGLGICREALSREHSVIAAYRNPDKIESHSRVEAVAVDINDVDTLMRQAERVDVVVSSVSPRNSGDPSKDALGFADALIAVSRRLNKRIAMVGGAGTLHHPGGTPVAPTVPETYRAEAIAMRRAYGRLVAEDINFTFLSPPASIAPGERTGKFRVGGRILLSDDDGVSRISVEDFAVALLDEIEEPKHFRIVFTVGY